MPTKQAPDPTKPNKPGGVRLPVYKPPALTPAPALTPTPAPTPAAAPPHAPDSVHVVKFKAPPEENTPVTDDDTLSLVTRAAELNGVDGTRISGSAQSMRAQINALLEELDA